MGVRGRDSGYVCVHGIFEAGIFIKERIRGAVDGFSAHFGRDLEVGEPSGSVAKRTLGGFGDGLVFWNIPPRSVDGYFRYGGR